MTTESLYNQGRPLGIDPRQATESINELVNTLTSSNEIKVKIRSELDNRLLYKRKTQILKIIKESEYKNSLRFKEKKEPSTNTQKLIELKLREIKAYVVTTKSGDPIIAFSIQPEEPNLGSTKQIKTKQYGVGTDNQVLLFFMSKDDASMYLQEICKKESSDSERLGLRVQTTNLESFYKISRKKESKIDSKLIADLREISTILNFKDYQIKEYIHPRQRRRSNYFFGTPVYIAKSTKDTNKRLLHNAKGGTKLQEKSIYFNLEDFLYSSKNMLRQKMKEEILPKGTEIYNLESLLLEMENMEKDVLHDYTFIQMNESKRELSYPNKKEIEKFYPYENLEKVSHKIKLLLKSCQKILKNSRCLLTQDSIPIEENIW
jgi:hypothetical protein